MPDWPSELEGLLPAYLAGQRWFRGSEPPAADLVAVDRAAPLWGDEKGRALWHVVVSVGDDRYQLLLGMRPAGEAADFLHTHEHAVLGSTEHAFFYDGTLDSEMSRALLDVISGGAQKAARVRPLTSEQSNTSIVYDDRIILKIYRRLEPGPNPDVEVTTALARTGFDHVAAPVVEWRDGYYDLAFGQDYLAGGTDGWALALTSLRALITSRDGDMPSESGGDFGFEAGRLGRVTAEMHLSLAAVFGIVPKDAARRGWTALVEGLPRRIDAAGRKIGKDLLSSTKELFERLQTVEDPGPAFRAHGDFHLGQVMRTDRGWYVLDFEGEPAKPIAERVAPSSGLKDVTGMLRSFHYASRFALVERSLPEWGQAEPEARAWEAHNRQSFIEGYRSHPDISRLLPDPASAPAVMIAYELDKALYELDYELAHRPEWVPIPLDALERLIGGGTGG